MKLNCNLAFLAGGLLSCLLCGAPSSSSLSARFYKWISTDPRAPPPTLWYFDARGRGEAIRIAFADRGLDLAERSFTASEWGRDRPDGLKAQMRHQLMFGQVPLLEVDGLSLVQSHSIFRFMARKWGWYDGYSEAMLATVDMVADGTEDVRKQLTAIKYDDALDDAVKSEKYASWCSNGAGPTWLGFYETIAKANFRSPGTLGGARYLAGTPEPSHGDYLMFDLLDTIDALAAPDLTSATSCAALVSQMSALEAWRQTMSKRPNLKAYLESPRRRPQ